MIIKQGEIAFTFHLPPLSEGEWQKGLLPAWGEEKAERPEFFSLKILRSNYRFLVEEEVSAPSLGHYGV